MNDTQLLQCSFNYPRCHNTITLCLQLSTKIAFVLRGPLYTELYCSAVLTNIAFIKSTLGPISFAMPNSTANYIIHTRPRPPPFAACTQPESNGTV